MNNVLRHPAADTTPVRNPARRGRLPKNVTRLPSPANATSEPRQESAQAVPHGIAIVHDDTKPQVMIFSAQQALDVSMNLMRAQIDCWSYMREKFPELFDHGDAQ